MFNDQQIKKTLEELIQILKELDARYCILGSVVTAAINGQLHRRLGDVDFILDKNKKDEVFKKLETLGYKRAGGMFAFGRKYMALETLVHPTLQSIGYFWGEWQDDGSFLMGNKFVNVSVEAIGIEPNKYSLCGVHFIGIPPRAVATGIVTSKHNIKRKKELNLLEEKGIKPLPNNYIHTRVFGMPFDWAYHGVMGFFNIIGWFRQKVGLSFDPWRSKIN
jgi:hypothetical protein